MLFTSLSPLLLGTFALAASATEAKSIGSNGCAKPFDFPAQPGGPSKGIQIGERKNRITLPKNYKQNVPAPLIFAFHDRNMTADDMEQATSLSADKLNPDAIVVYAAAVDDKWVSDDELEVLVNDKSFLKSFLNGIEERLCIDTDRVYASGLGTGAGFVHVLACDPHFSNRIAAFSLINPALFAGLVDKRAVKDEITMMWENCKPARIPVRLLEIHSENNTVQNYWGRSPARRHRMPVVQWLVDWAVRNECGTAEGQPEKYNATEKFYRTKLEGGTIHEGFEHPNKLSKAWYTCYERTQDEMIESFLETYKINMDEDRKASLLKNVGSDKDASDTSDGTADKKEVAKEKVSKKDRGIVNLMHYYLKNAGHGWPRVLLKEGSTEQVASERLVATDETPVFDATIEVLDWFNRHKLSDESRPPREQAGLPQMDENSLNELINSLSSEIKDIDEDFEGPNLDLKSGTVAGDKRDQAKSSKEGKTDRVKDEL